MANDLEAGFSCKSVINIGLPDVSQLDETTCPLLVCQHPQCWETVRRLQRGHPRIVQPISGVPKKCEDGLPTLKIVDLSLPDSSILTKRITDSVPFFKHPPSFAGDSKFDSDLQSSLEAPHLLGLRSPRGFSGQGFAHKPRKSAKLPVLNLNATHLPKCSDGGNLVMVWIPGEQVQHKKPDQKHRTNLSRDKKSFVPLKISKIIPCQEWVSKREPRKKKRSTEVPTGGQPCSTQLMHRWLRAPPPSPVLSPSHPEYLSSWASTFPKHSLMSPLSNEEKTISRMDQVDRIIEETLFQEGHQLALSKTKMILAVHRINLQELNEESMKSRELLELNPVSMDVNFLPQKDSIVSAEEEQIEEDKVMDQTQLPEPEAQEVEPEETSEAALAVDKKLRVRMGY